MPQETRVVSPGPDQQHVRLDDGSILRIPSAWKLLPPGDAGMTRRLKSTGPTWTVKQKKGRRTFSLGVWADQGRIEQIQADLKQERGTDAYAKRKLADATRRNKKQSQYVDEFFQSVLAFLNFSECHQELANQLAAAVTQHATPVGSGTVARTQRIPIERRAESAVIAWMRHQTTAYDNMKIPRVKGKRREVRRMLAKESKILLQSYRVGASIDPNCPLIQAMN